MPPDLTSASQKPARWSGEKIILTIAAFAALIESLYLGISSPYGGMGIGFLAFLVLLFFANLDKFSEFRAGRSGIEAKLREAERVVEETKATNEEAKATLEQLRRLTKHVGFATLSLARNDGSFESFSPKTQGEIKQRVVGIFDEAGIPKEEQEAILTESWYPWIEQDYVFQIQHVANKHAKEKPQNMPEWNVFLERIKAKKLPQPEELKEVFAKYDSLTPPVEDVIEDYRYYQRHREHRRLDEWHKRYR